MAAHCTKLKAICANCGKQGHLSVKCKSPDTSTMKCSCCDEGGHVKADCPKAHLECHLCGKTGHMKNKCWHKDKEGFVKTDSKETQSKKQKGATEAGVCNAWAARWQCMVTNCGALYADADALGCSTCKQKRKKEPTPKPEKTQDHIPLKKGSADTYGRLMETPGVNGELPLPTIEKDALEQANKLKKDIAALELIDGAEGNVEAKKKELAKLKDKLPQPNRQHRDMSQILELRVELETKGAAKLKEEQAKKEKLQEKQAQHVTETEKRIAELEATLLTQKELLNASLAAMLAKVAAEINEIDETCTAVKAEVALKLANIKLKCPAISAETVQVPIAQAAGGKVVRECDVKPDIMVQELMADPRSAGMTREMVEYVTSYMLHKFTGIAID